MARILIIGAGASGLMAACELIGKKHSVIVVEARERAGGRINTLLNHFSFPVEAGAEFIHGKQPLTLSLVKKSKSETSQTAGNRYQIFNGEVEEGNFFEDEWDLLEKQLKHLKNDTTMAAFMDEHFPAGKYYNIRKRVKGFTEGFDVADINKVSALALRKEWSESDEGHQYHIHGGYIRLVDYLKQKAEQAGVDFYFSTAIENITWSEGNITAFSTDGRPFEADKLVITVPVGVLQKSTLKFSPPLSDHAIAFGKLGFGGVVKFMFEFESGFWDDLSHRPFRDWSFIVSDATIPTWWAQRPDKMPVLTGWLGGPPAEAISHDPAFLKETALQSLHKIFKYSKNEIENSVREFYIADWVKDPFTLGAYSYSTVESDKAIDFLLKPVKNTIYFAGEGMYKGPAMGTVEAALQSGKDVAKL